MTPEQLFLTNLPLVERVIAFVCRRHRLRPEEAEEFASTVRLKMVADDYAVLRKFEGKSQLATYLTTVVQRLFLDYRNHLWGKWRPSAEAKRIGPVAVELERLTTRDGLGFEEACTTLRGNHGVEMSEKELADIVARLPPRQPRHLEGEEALEGYPAPDSRPDHHLLDGEREQIRRRVEAALGRSLTNLPPEDRLILRLRMEDDFTVAEISRALHLDQKPLYRRMEAIFRCLRRALEEDGIEKEEVSRVLEEGR